MGGGFCEVDGIVTKVIVITGAGKGLGRALARRFAADGDRVVLMGRTASHLDALAAEIGDRALAVPCDVSSPDQVKRAFATIAERHARIDVLINNAAVYAPFLVAEATDDQIVKTIATNLTGAILCTRSGIPMMGRGGYVINVTSESVDMPFPHLVLYQTSKAGLEKFSVTLRRELEPSGIRVSFVRAGVMVEPDKAWDIDPVAGMRFAQAAMAAGLNLAERPMSQVTSVTQIFRNLIDLPPDLQAVSVCLHARAAD